MPVTAKLSRKFHETLGDEIANELVDWFNQVDLTYRGDFRELNELNFARFDAKLEQRFAEADAKLERRLAQFDVRFEHLEARFDVKLAQLRTELIKWMFMFWIGTVAMMFFARSY